MALPYRTWTDDEIKTRNVSPEGTYEFTIINVTRKRQKQKYDEDSRPLPVNEMIEIEFQYHDNDGMGKTVKEWIVFDGRMDWKLRHLARSTGLLPLYESGRLDCPNLIGKRGQFMIGIKDNEYKGEIRKQNFIKDYIDNSSAGSVAEDIPF